MAKEIERKFLVCGDGWRRDARGITIRQGYVCSDDKRAVRVRIAGSEAFLTIKGVRSGFTRAEYEYPIPLNDATEMLETVCDRPLIEKTRWTLVLSGVEWVVDVFEGENSGLVVAEIELCSESDLVVLPDWIGEEVTDDARYLNANLMRHPFRAWGSGNVGDRS